LRRRLLHGRVDVLQRRLSDTVRGRLLLYGMLPGDVLPERTNLLRGDDLLSGRELLSERGVL
jgi:hypothetical protein